MTESPAAVENVVILGSGCAGLTAAIYAARANLEPLVVMGVEAGSAWAERRDVAALFAWRDAAGDLRFRKTGAFDLMVELDHARRPHQAAAADGGG